MNWDELPERALETMKLLGDFRPLTDLTKKEVKGYMWDSEEYGTYKKYFSSNQLREMAEDLNLVAQWLDDQAKNATNPI